VAVLTPLECDLAPACFCQLMMASLFSSPNSSSSIWPRRKSSRWSMQMASTPVGLSIDFIIWSRGSMNFIHNGVAAWVVGSDPGANSGVVGVRVPPVVVPPVQARVVRGIATDQIALTAVAVQADHRLEVVAFDDKVLRLSLWLPHGVLGDRAAHPRPNATGEPPRNVLAGELDPDVGLLGFDKFEELIPRQVAQRPTVGGGSIITRRHAGDATTDGAGGIDL